MSTTTYFASPERSSSSDISSELALISGNPLVDSLMKAVHGLVAVLDKNRQILSINESMMKMLGIDNISEALGLRLGESIQCIHSHDMAAGCGTSRHCASCGAAIAMVACIQGGQSQDQICAATVKRQGQEIDLCLRVHCSALEVEESRFYLLFLQDITQQQAWAAMERVFFHDISNLLAGIVGTSDLLMMDKNNHRYIDRLGQLIPRLKNEVELQRSLTQANVTDYQPALQKISSNVIVQEISNTFATHPATIDKTLEISPQAQDLSVLTDCTLLLRVLSNMIINALEASAPGDTVKLWLEQEQNILSFHVWNGQAIHEKIKLRIFQRHFSTKEGPGRGLGTYSMQLFGETFLGGKVTFTSSADHGTTFSLTLPC